MDTLSVIEEFDVIEDRGVKAEKLLANNDSYSFFEALNDLVVTGPTRTNVNDIRVIHVL